MAYTTNELQTLVTNGYVPSTSGTTEITSQIIFNGSRKVTLEPNSFVWTGSGSSWPFAIDKSVTSIYPIVFNGVDVASSVDGSPILKQVDSHDTPDNLTCIGCDWQSLGAPAIDIDLVDYTVLPTFRDMITRGSGAIRMRGSGGIDIWHATSQMTIRGWTHIGSDRWGPAFNLRGCSGLVMENVSDTGSLALHSSLYSAGWVGPLSLYLQAPRTPNDIVNFNVDYDEVNDDLSPNCFIGEIRTDLGTGTGQHELVNLTNPTLRHAAIDAAVKPWRFMGGDDNVFLHALVIRIVDGDSPSVDDFVLGGRSAIWFDRPHYKEGESAKLAALEAFCDAIFTNGQGFYDPICNADGYLPGGSFESLVLYSGSDLEANLQTATQQPEDLLG